MNIPKFQDEVILMLLASRDCYKNQGREVKTFDCTDGYYGEAFGMMRALVNLGVIAPDGKKFYFGTDNFPEEISNAKWWFGELRKKALELETRLGLQEARKLLKECVYEDN